VITVASMIDELRALLRTWVTNEEQSATLAADIASDALGATVTTTRDITLGITSGIIEIERELIYASSVTPDGTVTIPAWGRGYMSTIAAAHVQGVRIISQPLYPRQKMLDKLNDTMRRMFPSVYAVKYFNTIATLPIITYDLPDDAERVLTGEWQLPDGRNYWRTIKHWRMNRGGRPTTASGNNPQQGVTVDVGDAMMPGRPIHFAYAAKPVPLVNETDDFATVTGFAESLKDVVIYGAAAALVIPNETARLQLGSMEQQDRLVKITPSAALTASRFLEQQFQTRLAEERKTQSQDYPPRVTGPWL
jgi:hypothetical protein